MNTPSFFSRLFSLFSLAFHYRNAIQFALWRCTKFPISNRRRESCFLQPFCVEYIFKNEREPEGAERNKLKLNTKVAAHRQRQHQSALLFAPPKSGSNETNCETAHFHQLLLSFLCSRLVPLFSRRRPHPPSAEPGKREKGKPQRHFTAFLMWLRCNLPD